MEWIIYPAALLVIIVICGVIMSRRSAASKSIAPSERSHDGEPIGSMPSQTMSGSAVLPERPAGPGAHF